MAHQCQVTGQPKAPQSIAKADIAGYCNTSKKTKSCSEEKNKGTRSSPGGWESLRVTTLSLFFNRLVWSRARRECQSFPSFLSGLSPPRDEVIYPDDLEGNRPPVPPAAASPAGLQDSGAAAARRASPPCPACPRCRKCPPTRRGPPVEHPKSVMPTPSLCRGLQLGIAETEPKSLPLHIGYILRWQTLPPLSTPAQGSKFWALEDRNCLHWAGEHQAKVVRLDHQHPVLTKRQPASETRKLCMAKSWFWFGRVSFC